MRQHWVWLYRVIGELFSEDQTLNSILNIYARLSKSNETPNMGHETEATIQEYIDALDDVIPGSF